MIRIFLGLFVYFQSSNVGTLEITQNYYSTSLITLYQVAFVQNSIFYFQIFYKQLGFIGYIKNGIAL